MTMPEPPLLTISREDLASLDIRNYQGPVHFVQSERELDQARRVLVREKVIGFDTETRPAFRKGEVHRPSLVQMAGEHAVYLFPLKKIDCADVLTEILENQEVVKAGIGLRDDFTKLRMRFDFQERATLDLSVVAKNQGVAQPSVRTMAGLFLRFRVTKGQSTSNWGRQELTERQILYAATDAWVCRELYLCFEGKGYL